MSRLLSLTSAHANVTNKRDKLQTTCKVMQHMINGHKHLAYSIKKFKRLGNKLHTQQRATTNLGMICMQKFEKTRQITWTWVKSGMHEPHKHIVLKIQYPLPKPNLLLVLEQRKVDLERKNWIESTLPWDKGSCPISYIRVVPEKTRETSENGCAKVRRMEKTRKIWVRGPGAKRSACQAERLGGSKRSARNSSKNEILTGIPSGPLGPAKRFAWLCFQISDVFSYLNHLRHQDKH